MIYTDDGLCAVEVMKKCDLIVFVYKVNPEQDTIIHTDESLHGC